MERLQFSVKFKFKSGDEFEGSAGQFYAGLAELLGSDACELSVKVSPLDGPSTPLRVPAPFLADNVKKAAESLCTELKEIEELEAECQRRRIALQRDRSPV